VKSPEGTSVPKELPADTLPNVEQSKSSKDRDYWWQWLHEGERQIRIKRTDKELLVGEASEFSESLSNQTMARILAELESDRLSPNKNIIDAPFIEWPFEVISALRLRRDVGPILDSLDDTEKYEVTFLDLCEALIENEAKMKYGFTGRYWSPEKLSETEIFERSIAIGTYFLEQVLVQQKWGDDIDAVLVTSAVLPETISLEIIKFAKQKGIVKKRKRIQTRDIRTACSGVFFAEVIAAKDKQIQKKDRAVIIALEPLGDLLRHHEDSWQLGNAGLSVFGNGFAAVAFNPSESQVDDRSKVAFVPDANKIIRYYSTEQSDEKLTEYWSRWMLDPQQLISIFSPHNQDHVAFTLNIPEPTVPGLAMEYGDPINYLRLLKELTEPFEHLEEWLSDEGLSGISVGTNQAAEKMTDRIKRVMHKLHPQSVENDADVSALDSQFDPSRANTSSASTISTRMKQLSDLNPARLDTQQKLALFLVATAIGASLAVVLKHWGSNKSDE